MSTMLTGNLLEGNRQLSRTPTAMRGIGMMGRQELYYLQSRYYNPETGRFLTRDTFKGEDTVPLSLNKYVYTGNNPVKHTDSSGHAVPAWLLGAIVYSFVETAIGFAITVSFNP